MKAILQMLRWGTLPLFYDAGVGESAAAEGAKTAGEAAAAEGTAGVAAGAAGGTGGGLSSADLAALYRDAGYAGTTEGALPGWVGTLGQGAATAAGTAAVQSALAPKRPDLPKQLAMPDPAATEEARRRALIDQMARRGRASTILTQASDGNRTAYNRDEVLQARYRELLARRGPLRQADRSAVELATAPSSRDPGP